MRLPRDITGTMLAKALQKLEYHVTRQTGSHIRVTRSLDPQHHITIPAHAPLKVGTFAAILSEIESHNKLTREKLLNLLFP